MYIDIFNLNILMFMRTSQKIDENLNKWPDLGLTHPFLTKSNKLWESNYTKEREF